MNRALFLLPLLFLLLLPLGARSERQPAVQRVTTGAGLWSLTAWAETGRLEATQRTRAGLAGVRVALRDGVLASAGSPRQVAHSDATVEVEGTTHRLLWQGKTVWETGDELLGRPAVSADGSWLVVERAPRGNETATLGELWRYDLASGAWLRLTQNQVEESSPAISPDGQRVAFLRVGDLWTIPADRTTRESIAAAAPARGATTGGFDHVPPATIRVIHVAARNSCRPTVPDGQIDTIPFEEYVRRVVPHESPASWHSEALKAQAVAARTYAWTYVLTPADPNGQYDVTDTTSHQYMCDETYPTTDEAVLATEGQHLTYQGGTRLITALFSAENSSPTRQNAYGHTYLSAVDDPISFGFTRNGHGQGYSQWGGKRWADQGWRYGQILRHYYSGASLEPPAGSSATLLEAANRPTAPYLRGAGLWLELNAANVSGTQAREYRLHEGNTPGPWQTGETIAGGWGHFFPISDLPDLPLDDYRIEYAPASLMGGNDLPVLYLGVDRSAPTLAVTSDLEEKLVGEGVTLTATFALTSSDGTSGVERTGWSRAAWQQEAERLPGPHPIFIFHDDEQASGGAGLRLEPNWNPDPLVVTFPAIAVEPGHYRLWFRLRTDAALTSDLVGTLRLFDEASPALQRGVRTLRVSDFPGSTWTWFHVDVDMTNNYGRCPTAEDASHPCALLTPVMDWPGDHALEIDRFLLATRPSAGLDEATPTFTVPDPVTLYASDGAGNLTLVQCVAEEEDAPPPPPPPPLGPYPVYLPLTSGGGATTLYRYDCP